MKNSDPVLSTHHRVVTDEEWLEARRALLREEKKAMKCHDEFTRWQRELPWRTATKNYVFTATTGDVSLVS